MIPDPVSVELIQERPVLVAAISYRDRPVVVVKKDAGVWTCREHGTAPACPHREAVALMLRARDLLAPNTATAPAVVPSRKETHR